LRLPAKDRRALMDDLKRSLDDRAVSGSDQALAEEAERRYEELRSGKVRGRSVAAVFRKAKARFR
ncbi:MAG: addiction module protein, partial [Phycisphaerae bacterium]|nr:addiction module protein [Phycisphaerae bacterium]